MAWLKGEVNSDAWRNARFRVAITHIPPQGGDGYTIQQVGAQFGPELNEAGLDLWLSGHMHRFIRVDPTPGSNGYHLIVNDSRTTMRIEVSQQQMTVTVFGSDGGIVDTVVIDHR